MRTGVYALLLVGALVPFLSVGVASAQCVGGRVANEQTQGRCCWPGQTFNAETAICTGAPTCPEGTVAHGDDCAPASGALATPPGPGPDGAAGGATVGVQAGAGANGVQAEGTVQGGAQASPTGVPTAPAGYGAAPAGQPYAAQPQGYAQPQAQTQDGQPYAGETRTVINKGMLIPGAITFGVSYGIAVFSAVVAEYGLLAIPVAGPFILMTEVNSSATDANLAYAGLTIWALAQTAGITLTILGLTLKREVPVVRADLGNGRTITVLPAALPGGAALTLTGTL